MKRNGNWEPAVVKAWVPGGGYGIVFDSEPDKVRFQALEDKDKNKKWRIIAWEGDEWGTQDLRPLCPACGHPLLEGRVAWTKCLNCGKGEPGADSHRQSARLQRNDPYAKPRPNYAEPEDSSEDDSSD